ncbi:MAG: hypothetical protein ACRDU5_07180 [Mycobacterium sp.]
MNFLKKIAVTATMTAAAGVGALGFAAAPAQADKGWWHVPDPVPPPGVINHVPFAPPPGQIAKLPFVPPPGHWDKPWKWLP